MLPGDLFMMTTIAAANQHNHDLKKAWTLEYDQ